LICPNCKKGKLRVINKREDEKTPMAKRTRVCPKCKATYRSEEIIKYRIKESNDGRVLNNIKRNVMNCPECNEEMYQVDQCDEIEVYRCENPSCKNEGREFKKDENDNLIDVS